MIIPNSDRETHYERWLELRRGGLTSTDVAAILSGRKTMTHVYLEKQRSSTFGGNIFTEWGNLMEPKILDALQQATKCTIVANDQIWQHPDDPAFLSTPDGFWECGCVEVKTTGRSWEGMHDDIPLRERFARNGIPGYYVQVQDHILGPGEGGASLFGWFVRRLQEYCRIDYSNGVPVATKIGVVNPTVEDLFEIDSFDYIEVPPDADIQSDIRGIREKWKEFVPLDLPPVDPELWELKEEEQQLKARLRDIGARVVELTEGAGFRMGESYAYPQGTVTLFERQGTAKFDKTRLKSEHPEAYKKYVEAYTTLGAATPVTRITLAKEKP